MQILSGAVQFPLLTAVSGLTGPDGWPSLAVIYALERKGILPKGKASKVLMGIQPKGNKRGGI